MRYRGIILLASLLPLIKGQPFQTVQFSPSQLSAGFIPAGPTELINKDKDNDLETQAAVQYRPTPAQQYEYEEGDEEEERVAIIQQTQRPVRRQQVQYVQKRPIIQLQQQQNKPKQQLTQQESEELLEEEEPDRLGLLLQNSKFNCNSKTGYYADESLGCEVFHYCQDNTKHSWICPEGFSFHQVHLICMPSAGDNICEQSSKYHIVNDYLYKPINVEEHQTKPNISLRYSERYYPEDIYLDERQERDEYTASSNQHRQPIQVGLQKVPASQYRAQPQPTQPRPHSQQQYNTQQQHNVYRSPEEINISLQQRRPQQQVVFTTPTTARYEEEEYSFEK